MLREIKDFLKLNLLPSRLAEGSYGTCLDDQKILVLKRYVTEALNAEAATFLEFGVARGGTTCLLSKMILDRKMSTKLYSFDSFEGFSSEEWETSMKDGSVTQSELKDSFIDTSESFVRRKLEALGLSGPVILIKGYFEDSLPLFVMPPVDLCFIDCDLPLSVTLCAETVWPKLNPGGLMIFDDYTSPEYGVGVRRAVDSFVATHASAAKIAREEGGLFIIQK